MDVEAKINGFEALAAKLRELAPAMRKKVLRNALAAGARVVRDEAKRKTPVLSRSVKAPYRKPGTVRDAIKVRTSKVASKAGDVGVFVNVKPLKAKQIRAFKAAGGGRGSQNPNDPYYWQWLEFGRAYRASVPKRGPAAKGKRGGRSLLKFITTKRPPRGVGAIQPIGFLKSGAGKLPAAFDIFQKQVVRWIDKVNSTGKVVP